MRVNTGLDSFSVVDFMKVLENIEVQAVEYEQKNDEKPTHIVLNKEFANTVKQLKYLLGTPDTPIAMVNGLVVLGIDNVPISYIHIYCA